MTEFSFRPAEWIPFRDQAVLERIRRIKKEDITRHANPDFRIRVVRDSSPMFLFFTDAVARIMKASAQGDPTALIVGNPNPGYAHLAHMINRLEVDCRRLHIFNMDEWADEQGRTAPESYPQGFMHAMKRYFYHELDERLRPPEDQIQGPTTANIKDYGKRIADFGGADACYSGSGWTAHIAFIDPDTPEFSSDLEEWKRQGPCIVTLNPITIAQNSLHASFGRCGDMAAVPPKAATIGPAEVIGAKYRMDLNAITLGGSDVSWQRFITRLIAHGPVTPQVPASILQTLATDFYIAETIAENVEPIWYAGY